MKVLLVSANTERMNNLPLPIGPAFVAAATRKAGHDVILLNLMFEEDPTSAIEDCISEFRPDVIGICATSMTRIWPIRSSSCLRCERLW